MSLRPYSQTELKRLTSNVSKAGVPVAILRVAYKKHLHYSFLLKIRGQLASKFLINLEHRKAL